MNNARGISENINNYFNKIIPFDTQKKLGDFGGFLSSNTMIAKATFLLGVVIIFSILFYVGSKIIYYVLSPSQTPYLIDGMKDASEAITITQNLAAKNQYL